MRKILDLSKKHPLLTSLFIGILGCALWAYWLDPLCRKFFTVISSMISIVFTSFLDQTYRQVSYGTYHNDTIATIELCYGILLMPIVGLEYSLYLKAHSNKNPQNANLNDFLVENSKKIRIRFRTKVIIINCIIALLLTYNIGSISFINTCKTITLCNIEIVAPYISDQEYKELKASFYSISTKNDYDNLQTVIDNIAVANGLTLK